MMTWRNSLRDQKSRHDPALTRGALFRRTETLDNSWNDIRLKTRQAMPRFRITMINEDDRTQQLRLATRVRGDLIARAPVWLDPDRPVQGIHRNREGQSYLEFATDDLNAVRSVLHLGGHDRYTTLIETHDPLGEPCQNCGNISGPVSPPECPNCGFKDISACPICGNLSPRQDYEQVSGTLFLCPNAIDGIRHRVRLLFNEPMFRPDGRFNEPLVIVKDAARRAVRS
jgi:hypothetical protein